MHREIEVSAGPVPFTQLIHFEKENNILNIQCVYNIGIYSEDIYLVDLDFSDPHMAANRIKTMLVFS